MWTDVTGTFYIRAYYDIYHLSQPLYMYIPVSISQIFKWQSVCIHIVIQFTVSVSISVRSVQPSDIIYLCAALPSKTSNVPV